MSARYVVLLAACLVNVALGIGLKSARSVPIKSSTTLDVQARKAELLEVVQDLGYGLKETGEQAKRIQEIIASLRESKTKISSPALAFAPPGTPSSSYQKSILTGKWDLKYTNAPDVLNIGKIPGVKLKYVGQKVDTVANTITNVIYCDGPLASEQEVYVGIRPVSPTRVELDFLGTKIKLKKIFGRTSILGFKVDDIKPFEIAFDQEQVKKSLAKDNRPTPAFELEYLDENLRIHRTAENYTFVITKVDAPTVQVEAGVSLLKDGIGPWLKDKIGEDGMRALGLLSVTPYLMFFYLFVQKLATGGFSQ
jgi:hypothetical protein